MATLQEDSSAVKWANRILMYFWGLGAPHGAYFKKEKHLGSKKKKLWASRGNVGTQRGAGKEQELSGESPSFPSNN